MEFESHPGDETAEGLEGRVTTGAGTRGPVNGHGRTERQATATHATPACHTRRQPAVVARSHAVAPPPPPARHKPCCPYGLFVQPDRLLCDFCPLTPGQAGPVAPADPFRLSPLAAHMPYYLSYPETQVAPARPAHSTNHKHLYKNSNVALVSYTDGSESAYYVHFYRFGFVINSRHTMERYGILISVHLGLSCKIYRPKA